MKDKQTTMNVDYTQANPYQELKLLSINEARKRLGIRRGNLLKLIRDKKLISKITASGYFRLQGYDNSFNEAFTLIESDKADLILEIPQGFERNLKTSQSEGFLGVFSQQT